MKYKTLLVGENNAIIDDFFFHMSDDFDIMTTSSRNDDIMNHLDIFRPDILVYCTNEDSKKDFNRMYFLKEKLIKKGILLGVIGSKEICREFEKISLDSADIMLVTPCSTYKIMFELHTFIGKKKYEQLERDGEKRRKQEMEEEEIKEEETKEEIKEEEQKEENREYIKKKHILVIDDDPMMLKLVNEQLHERYNVATAISGKLALTFLNKKQTDLILLDYEMPGDNGVEVLKKLRSNPATKDIPVVFLTGVSNYNAIKEVIDMKPQGYLLKPIDSENLLKVIMDVLGKK